MGLSKQQIRERYHQLELEAAQAAEVASDSAYRHAKAKQGGERLGLRAACEGSGGHLFVVGGECCCCGAKREDVSNTLAKNLSTSFYKIPEPLSHLTGY